MLSQAVSAIVMRIFAPLAAALAILACPPAYAGGSNVSGSTALPCVSIGSEISGNAAFGWCAPPSTKIPCLGDICLGDDIVEKRAAAPWIDRWPDILKVFFSDAPEVAKLDSSRNDRPKSPPRIIETDGRIKESRAFVRDHVRGVPVEDAEKLMLYLAGGVADLQLLELIARTRPVFCRPVSFVLRFVSSGGHLTAVDVKAKEPGRLQVALLQRRFTLSTGDTLSNQETLKAIIDAHPLAVGYAAHNEVPKTYVLGQRAFRASGSALSNATPFVRYELADEIKGGLRPIDYFDSASQPGCAPRAQSID